MSLIKQFKKKNQHLETIVNLTYNSNYSFYKYYRDNKKIDNLCSKSKVPFLGNFFDDSDKFNKLKTQKEKTEKKKKTMCIIQLRNYIMVC